MLFGNKYTRDDRHLMQDFGWGNDDISLQGWVLILVSPLLIFSVERILCGLVMENRSVEFHNISPYFFQFKT